jgi:hypothetical protein
LEEEDAEEDVDVVGDYKTRGGCENEALSEGLIEWRRIPPRDENAKERFEFVDF